ncbi:RNA-guided endonuclease InsQ/TnpB family protein [Pseudoclavibacter sp. VKM Ac-2867]|uniref:RNA-guided endonuclease InsQ/TnpB family protein n=1 Tax=Pseudoclavibacter sp. VKM Ac-2867 TaxID=2783829 RepID=UPI00188BD7B0|nr:RNA-guided endonuclease TnpB family protein [Pseudoclavibacter sp. VKM Ac-2867]MBF4459376.1 transposase [Pseudoclavibacter sp. VKM Ac-2867]
MKVRYTYRLRPGARAVDRLVMDAGLARWVWNQAVAAAKAKQPWWTDKTLTAARKEHDWLAAGSVVVQQQVLRDFRASKHRKRFKSVRRTQPSLNYTLRGFSLRAHDTGRVRLILAGRVSVPVVWSRPLPSVPSSVRVYRDALGHWWASFVVDIDDDSNHHPETGKSVGIDWGVARPATATDRTFDLEHPNLGRKAAVKLAAAQRRMARRKPKPGVRASRGYQAAKRQAAKIHERLRNQRREISRAWAAKVVASHDVIAVEDFRPRFLASTTMARKAADGGLGILKRALIEQGQRAGRQVVLVPPAYTTMNCANCGTRAKTRLALSTRTYTCATCGNIDDRDHNAAVNVLLRAQTTLGAGLDPADVEAVRHEHPRVLAHAESGIPRL